MNPNQEQSTSNFPMEPPRPPPGFNALPPPPFPFPANGPPPPFLPPMFGGLPPPIGGAPLGANLPPFPFVTSPVITIPNPEIVKADTDKSLNMEPSHTVYVSNLNERVKMDELKYALNKHFKVYGEIIDIVAQKNLRMRGQAFIIFSTIEAAKEAVEKSQRKPLFFKEMLLQFSHNRSDKIALREGKLDENRRLRREKMVKRLEERRHHQPMIKPTNNKNNLNSNGQPSLAPPKAVPDHLLLNKILFLTNLPSTIEQNTLEEIFKQYPGFKEVRLVPGKSDIAFVEYDTEMQAAMAKSTLNNYPIDDDHSLKITFAKR